MIVPNALQIEAAYSEIKARPVAERPWDHDQICELAEALGRVDGPEAFGYNLGLQTARVVIRSSVAIAKAGVNPEDVL